MVKESDDGYRVILTETDLFKLDALEGSLRDPVKTLCRKRWYWPLHSWRPVGSQEAMGLLPRGLVGRMEDCLFFRCRNCGMFDARSR